MHLQANSEASLAIMLYLTTFADVDADIIA